MKPTMKLLVLVASVIGVLGIAAAGWAYWSAGGSGAASATVGTMNPPTGVTASAVNHVVTVTWAASSAGGSAVAPENYTIERYTSAGVDSGPASCGVVAAVGTLQCVDTVANLGSYEYKVSAVFRSWTATSGFSSAVGVTAGPAAQLAFTQQPSNSTGGAAFTTQPKVTVLDSYGYTVSGDSSAVTLSITSGTPTSGGPGTLGGLVTVNANSGVATFSGLSINTAGTGYKLHAVDGSLTVTDSSAFNVTVGAAARLAFTQQPSNSTGGSAFATQPRVTVQDAGGNTVTGDASSVTLSITSGTPTSGGPGPLSGCTQTETAGVISLAGCKIDKVGTGYKLHAIDGTLTTTDSSAFDITVGPAAKLAFTQQPNGAAGGSAFATQPRLTVQDAGGNTVTGDASSVTLSITSGTPTSGGPGTLSGCTQTETAGVISLAGCKIDKVGTGYKLHAIDGTLTAADSSSFDVSVGSPTQLSFSTQPSTTATGGTAFATQPQVTVKDAGGNTVASSPVTMTVTAGSGGGAGGTLACTANPVNTNGSGVATFASCSINTASATAYTLTATDGAATATSSGITISVGSAAQLAFTQQPASSTGGVAFGTQPKVAVQDAGGNTVTGNSSAVTLSVTSGTPTSGGPGTLAGTVTVNASSGVATFSGLSINTAGTGYKLHAIDGSLTAADSNTFNVTTGAAAKLAFVQQPTTANGGATITPAVTVQIQDLGGNPVATSVSVGMAIANNAGPGGVLSGTTPVTSSASGLATFSNLSINKAGTGYTLTATSGSLTAATSTAFNITSPAITAVSINNKSGGTLGKAEAGDTIVFTYSAGLKMTSICSASTLGNTTSGSITPSATSTTVTLTKSSGSTPITFGSSECTLHLGNISLPGVYVGGSNGATLTFAGSSVAWNGSNTITVTLGSTVTGSTATLTTSLSNTFNPDVAATDPAGNAISGTQFGWTGSNF